jgi:integrase
MSSIRVNGRPMSGHVFVVDRQRGPQWYVKYRLPDGRQVQKRLGPAWTGRGRPRAGYLTRRSAQELLDEILAQARAGTLPGMVRTGATFAMAAQEWLRFIEFDRQRKRSTVRGYRSQLLAHLLPTFGDRPLEAIDAREIERWRSDLAAERRLSNATINRLLVALHGIFERARRVWGLKENPVRDVDRQPTPPRVDIDVYSIEEVMALVRAAGDEQDAAIFLTAAFTGLRMGELVGLRWRDVDFVDSAIRVRQTYLLGAVDTPKSGKGRVVPMVEDVASALARLSQREHFTTPDDVVFPGINGGYLDDSALRRRYKVAQAKAGLRPLRFHDLRHTFGTHAIRAVDPRELQEWMGHADFSTTEIYLSYRPSTDAAQRLGRVLGQDVRAPSRNGSSRILDGSPGPHAGAATPSASGEPALGA